MNSILKITLPEEIFHLPLIKGPLKYRRFSEYGPCAKTCDLHFINRSCHKVIDPYIFTVLYVITWIYIE